MEPILSKLKANIYDHLVNSNESKISYKSDLLQIKLDEFQNKCDIIIEKKLLKLDHQLAKYEISAGIDSDYIKRLIEEKVSDVEKRFYWKERVILQKIKRAKSEASKEKLETKLVNLKAKKEAKVLSIKQKYINSNPSKDDLLAYKEKASIYAKAKEVVTQTLKDKYQAKQMMYQKKIDEEINIHQKKVKLYTDILVNIEKEMKQTNAVVLDEDIALSVKNLSMHFGGLKAVDDLSFDVKKGEIFGLIGPNGAGKTTVFNCITKFYKPTSGDMYFRNANKKTIHLNKVAVHNVIKEGVVRTFQNVELVWELNILDNLLVAAHSAYRSKFFGHLLHSRLTKREEIIFTKRAMKILNDLNLTDYTFAFPIGLPYGVLKKVELARTLMTNPKMIILDEPAAGLNDAETKELSEFIKVIRDEYNLTIFLVEHDMGLVMGICDTVCAISFGKKLAMGTPKEIQKSKVVQEAYLGGD